jgi:thiol-disulfide isomerase/thioredoxin
MSARPPRTRPMRKPVSRTPAWVAPVAVVAAIALLVVAFLVIRWYTTPVAPHPLPLDATEQVVSSIAGLPATELDAVGTGSANNLIKRVSGASLTGPNGHPEVFYLGAEYCPYCAAERWPMIIALSRFGTFSGLKTTSSSSSDVYPNTPTFTFHGATYTSQYVDFVSVETTDRDRNPLESPTSAQQALANQYDTSGSIPFVDVGNRYAFSGAMYLPDVLSGMSWQAVADSLAQPSSPQAKAILGSANLITAAVCKLTADQPATVCSSSTIQSIEKTLG